MGNMKIIDKPKTITQTVLEVFDGFEVGEEYSGLELKRMCVNRNPKMKFTYVETCLKILRAKRRPQFICISHQKSKYLKIKEK